MVEQDAGQTVSNAEEASDALLQHEHEELLSGKSLSPEDWDTHRFRFIAIIQQAARNQGKVELAEDQQTGLLVAVKAMPFSWACESHEEFILAHPEENELPWRDIATTYYLSKALRLNCVCEFIGLYRRIGEPPGNESELCFVLSYCAGGDLFSWLERSLQTAGTDRETHAQPLIRHVLHAVSKVHRHGLAHGDLSLENILLTDAEDRHPEAVQVRLIDFGASTGPRATGSRGKPSYQAPEVHSGAEYDARVADAFSLGVMAFALVVGDYPWRSTRRHLCPCFGFAVDRGFPAYLARRKMRRRDGTVVTLAETLSPHVVSLLSGMLSVSPVTRLTVPAALEHPWFAGHKAGPSTCGDPRPPSSNAADTTGQV